MLNGRSVPTPSIHYWHCLQSDCRSPCRRLLHPSRSSSIDQRGNATTLVMHEHWDARMEGRWENALVVHRAWMMLMPPLLIPNPIPDVSPWQQRDRIPAATNCSMPTLQERNSQCQHRKGSDRMLERLVEELELVRWQREWRM